VIKTKAKTQEPMKEKGRKGLNSRIAITSEGQDLECEVSHRIGISKYFLIIDIESMDIEVVPNPTIEGQSGGGIQLVVIAITKKVDAVLTGYCSPVAEKYLTSNGIGCLTGVSGTVRQAIKDYKKGLFQKHETSDKDFYHQSISIDRIVIVEALKRSKNQFVNLLPILTGVVLLIGLFNALASKDILVSIFSGNTFKDLLSGAFFGSILSGNPINSYVIGKELLDKGVGLFAVTAFITTWVTVGIIQLPAEISAIGMGFALVRNTLSFIMSMVIAMFTVIVIERAAG
jgi:predicted Fe-Mo cluster-binding NifX family protein